MSTEPSTRASLSSRWDVARHDRLPLERKLLHARLADLGRRGRSTEPELPSLEPLVLVVSRLARLTKKGQPSLELLCDLLDGDTNLRDGLRNYVARFLTHGHLAPALSELGILPAHGLGAELRERLIGKVLPSAHGPNHLGQVLVELLDSQRSYAVVETASAAVLERLLELATPDDPETRTAARLQTLRALDLLAHRLAAGGEDPLFYKLDPSILEHESPFLQQAARLASLSQRLRESVTTESSELAFEKEGAEARVMLLQCASALRRAKRRSSKTGATLRMTYELERLQGIVERLLLLLEALHPAPASNVAPLFSALAAAATTQTDVLDLLARSSRLVAAEIVSHAGRTGDHYITTTRKEWFQMLLAAGGGGFAVALLAVCKAKLSALHAPPLFEALLFSANYGLGFIAVMWLGMTIATKQPAFTAAALASSLESGDRDASRLARMLQRLGRTQIAAIVGNVAIALPTAWLFGIAFTAWTGAPLLDPIKAAGYVIDTYPIASHALSHAALTGIWLTLSGVCAGAVSNSIVARHVVQRLLQSAPLQRRLGNRKLSWLANQVDLRAGGIAGCLVLGVLLGSTGTVGDLIGLDIDIRHVSFSSASLGLALASGAQADPWAAGVGLAGIGVMNLGVSFGCSLAIAWHARKHKRREARGLARSTWKLVWRGAAGWLIPVGPSSLPEEPSESED